MTKIEETIELHPITGYARRERENGYAIGEVFADDFCNALTEEQLPIDREASERTVEWDIFTKMPDLAGKRATVPLDTIFPESSRHRTRELTLRSPNYRANYRDQTGERYEITVSGGVSSTWLTVTGTFHMPLEKATDGVRRFRTAFKTLEDQLRKEMMDEDAERRRKDKEERERFGDVHPDSFGGSDY